MAIFNCSALLWLMVFFSIMLILILRRGFCLLGAYRPLLFDLLIVSKCLREYIILAAPK